MPPMKAQIQRQREYFALLAEFFRRATGESPEQFARTTDEFGDRVRREAYSLGPRHAEAAIWFYPVIAEFYQRAGMTTFHDAKALGGLRFVLGGTSQFRESHFRGVRKALLYADTILIADPVLPWIESPREEERFRDVILLREVFSLLRLKPLVDADLAYPAVFVFQSWEKSLQDRDSETTDRILQLTTGVVGHHIGQSFASIEELVGFADNQTDVFLERVEKGRIFVAPGMSVAAPLRDQLDAFMAHQRTWRVGQYLEQLEELGKESPARLVLAGLFERMGHQFHLMENSEELAANPMLCVEQQWHYHELPRVPWRIAWLQQVLSTKLLSEPCVLWRHRRYIGSVTSTWLILCGFVKLTRTKNSDGRWTRTSAPCVAHRLKISGASLRKSDTQSPHLLRITGIRSHRSSKSTATSTCRPW